MTEKQDLHIGAHEGDGKDIISGEDFGRKLFTGLSVFADVGVKLGKSLDEHTAKVRKQNSLLQRNTPTENQFQASGTANASGTVLIALGKPDQGTYWEVAQSVIGGSDINVVAAGKAGLYVSGSDSVTGGLTNLADYAAALPNVGFYGNHQIVVNSGEWLIAVIFNGTPNQVYYAAASVTVFNVAAAGGLTVTAT